MAAEMISEKISGKILVVGQDYINHKGGVGGILENYSLYFEKFNFIPTYPSTKPEKKLSSFPFFLRSLKKIIAFLLKNREIKIVHIHGAARGSLIRKIIIFTIIKAIFKKKVIFHSHGGALADFYSRSPVYLKFIFRFFFNNVDKIICLSPQWLDFFKTKFSPKSVCVLENMVLENKMPASDKHNPKLTLLFLGIVCDAKGIFDLIDVIIDNKEEFKGRLSLRIGGKGEIDRLNKLIEYNELSDIISFEGWVSGDVKARLLNESDIYILPSHFEALPLSILEAMTYALPIIATNVGGVPEIVKNNINGFLIQPGDKNQLAISIRKFLSDKSLAPFLGKSSASLVEQYYPRNVIPKLVNIYEELI